VEGYCGLSSRAAESISELSENLSVNIELII
jgi:hypothetical protein